MFSFPQQELVSEITSLEKEVLKGEIEKHRESTGLLTKSVEFSTKTIRGTSEYLKEITLGFKDSLKFHDSCQDELDRLKEMIPRVKANIIQDILENLCTMFEGDSRGVDTTDYPHNFFKIALFERKVIKSKVYLERTFYHYPPNIQPKEDTRLVDIERYSQANHTLALKTKELQTIEDIASEFKKDKLQRRWMNIRTDQNKDYRSIASAPIEWDGDVVAVLVIDTDRERYFLEDQNYRIFLGRILSPFLSLISIGFQLERVTPYIDSNPTEPDASLSH